ncbi:hypothetical protein [Streptomyces naphthomycinicus]|uniref:hypothetical protein n=1 Tax=Streptomyces naphthomycinicus TaxID=2872625 RepID=UPI001CEDFE71|nr:hypothetical protein [Streptomyces sp. TML10]
MNAALSLHTVLSLRLDASEAYRLAHAYRDEELQKYADRLASRASLYGDSATVGEVIKDLRSIATRSAGDEVAPDFFQPGRTYAYDADGFTAPELLTLFRVVADTTHPDTGKRMAFGWIRTAEDVAWSPYAEPADEWPGGWTDVTEGGGGQ